MLSPDEIEEVLRFIYEVDLFFEIADGEITLLSVNAIPTFEK